MALNPKDWGGNGHSRPVGARNYLVRRYRDDLLASYEKHGAAVIEQLRWRNPLEWLKRVEAQVPKELQIDVTHSALTSEERERMIELLRQQLAKIEQQKQLLIEAKVVDGSLAH